MKQQNAKTSRFPLSAMSEVEILTHFKRYRFKDKSGHDLEMCADFLDLVHYAKQSPLQRLIRWLRQR
ncbi:hypothetical protein [Kingella negevensis]|uniref:Uncharacterized protein n=1 Tax=Kingella negevensis TaxID=1522312 RepID=A0A238TDY9_9NEIS|nr:hypothetical protein [Kingella negevensis]MDK4680153.1 hypothetical protein [Kingella negevensis]MDK4682127.1 hypothetical protein [Kingella negevensis]MDK4685572.1 hypothetical protein [Kingella negevensis]MDK4689669.1 hypothetical protein [Kingella negevensis]MDK4690323.1 hypothetical protein [Kingella negevensis]